MILSFNKLDQKTWDTFVLEHGPRSGRFLQTWGWGEFQKSVGEKVDRVGWMDGTKIIAIAQMIQKKILPFGSYTYIPRGPIVIEKHEFDFSSIVSKNLFVRIEPEDVNLLTLFHKKYDHLYLKSPDVQPSHTLITNLQQSEDYILANMHEKTRYNIRLAEKKGVKIEINNASIEEFWPVFETTSSRDEFRLHGKEYYRKMLKAKSVFIAVAKHEEDILAANIMIDFGNTRTYLHGASSNVKRNFMAPYLLHWELMKDAKMHGIKFYDWWGVSPKDADEHHPWAGISRFKRGFNGEEVSFPGTFDLVLSPIRYMFYKLVRKLRRLI